MWLTAMASFRVGPWKAGLLRKALVSSVIVSKGGTSISGRGMRGVVVLEPEPVSRSTYDLRQHHSSTMNNEDALMLGTKYVNSRTYMKFWRCVWCPVYKGGNWGFVEWCHLPPNYTSGRAGFHTKNHFFSMTEGYFCLFFSFSFSEQ